MMANFRTGLFFQDNDGLPYILTAPLRYDSSVLNRTIEVPTGFKTDLASIPRFLWAVLPKSGKYDRGAVVHDFLYTTGICTRKEADDVLNEAMKVLGVGTWSQRTIYAGVRIGGWKTWGDYRKKDVAVA